MNKRQETALLTKKHIIDAATILISEKGIENTSVDEITEKAGVSKGSFYTYFKKKEDIVYEISNDDHYRFYLQAKNLKGDIFSKLEYFLVNEADSIEKFGYKLCQSWVKNSVDEVNQVYQTVMDNDISYIKKLLLLSIKENELLEETPIDKISKMLIEMLYGQMLCWDISQGTYSFKESTKTFCEMFLKNILKDYVKE